MLGSKLEEVTQYQAVLRKDKRYNGLFYFTTTDTKIYHRPSCSTPHHANENYSFFANIRSAKSRGLVACKHCHPNRINSGLSTKILKSIDAGMINDKGVGGLARSLHISEQHLRRVVRNKTGSSPIHLNNERRLVTAKRLTLQTKLPITEVAFSSGFSSIRQFNDEFKRAFKASPREMRKVALPLPPMPLYMALLWVFRHSA